jgi:hypothetical protein
MPCYRCGTRQVDPDRGESPWRRGVRGDRQVLICPGCQAAGACDSDLDRCAVCSSARLVRRLGEVECRDCGSVGQPVPGTGTAADQADEPSSGASGLAEEVEQALARVLGGSSQRPPYAMS